MVKRTTNYDWEAEPHDGPVIGGRREPSDTQIYEWAAILRENRSPKAGAPEPTFLSPEVCAVLRRGDGLDCTVLDLIEVLGSANRHTLARLTGSDSKTIADCVERLWQGGDVGRLPDGLYVADGGERYGEGER
ncbi:hypothetical protein [Alienimonas sp. DA493]|uniref:hypothetical protein n=1 Tax=Alienimonas sp. DA493 TaxID=3373605 RepID=UPI0037543542